MAEQTRELIESYDAGDGWDGDSAGTDLRGSEVAKTETPKPPVTRPTRAATAVETPPAETETPAETDDDLGEDDPADVEDDEAPGENETDSERQAREQRNADRQQARDEQGRFTKGKRSRSWHEEQRRRAAERFRLSEARRQEETELARIRGERERLERELAELRAKPTTEKPAEKPAKTDADDPEPDYEQYVEAGKPEAFHKDHADWLRRTLFKERDEKLSAAIEEAKKAGKEEAAKELETRQAEAREQQLQQEFLTRRDAYFEKNPKVAKLGQQTIPDLRSAFLNTIVVRHPNGMQLYEYLARHPRQAYYFAEHLEPKMTQPFMTALRRADNPALLIGYLAQHPGEVDRLSGLPPADALLALGELNVTLRTAGESDTPTSRRPAPSVTNAAPPLRSVAGRSSGGGGSGTWRDKHPDEWTPADREQQRKDRLAARRR
jgi:hypothetical protein